MSIRKNNELYFWFFGLSELKIKKIKLLILHDFLMIFDTIFL